GNQRQRAGRRSRGPVRRADGCGDGRGRADRHRRYHPGLRRMALIVLCSAKAAPGVTVTALAFTLTWNRPLILAECDPAGGDIAAGYLREVRLDGRGLGRLTASLGRRRLAEDLWTQ